jgi:hypothetical protein
MRCIQLSKEAVMIMPSPSGRRWPERPDEGDSPAKVRAADPHPPVRGTFSPRVKEIRSRLYETQCQTAPSFSGAIDPRVVSNHLARCTLGDEQDARPPEPIKIRSMVSFAEPQRSVASEMGVPAELAGRHRGLPPFDRPGACGVGDGRSSELAFESASGWSGSKWLNRSWSA